MELLRREVGEHLAERAKAACRLIKIPIRLRLLEAQRVFHKIVHAPEAAVLQIRAAIQRAHELERLHRRLHLPLQVLGDEHDVVHQRRDVVKRAAVDLLQDIAPPARRLREIGDVDVPAAVGRAGDRLCVQCKLL